MAALSACCTDLCVSVAALSACCTDLCLSLAALSACCTDLCLSLAAFSACCTDLCVCHWRPFQHVVPTCVCVSGRPTCVCVTGCPFSMLYRPVCVSVAALSACCTDLFVCQWPPFQHVVPTCVCVSGRPFSMLYRPVCVSVAALSACCTDLCVSLAAFSTQCMITGVCNPNRNPNPVHDQHSRC